MIVVFVVDTSPSMKKPASDQSGVSRLDLAKQAVEHLSKDLRKRHAEHHRRLQEQSPDVQRSMVNCGLGMIPHDSFLLLSTSRQHPGTGSCAAGGRLLVSFNGADRSNASGDQNTPALVDQSGLYQSHLETFQRELKGLKATDWDASSDKPFPDGGGGAVGLNTAVSAGLQILSRYRLQNRSTENFGMGRIPSTASISSSGAPSVAALQPACLIILTDGDCLRKQPKHGGGALQLQFGSQPLREFYKEPFRWDQRIFCVGVGGPSGSTSSEFLHSQIRALCEVTGGSHWMLHKPANLHYVTEGILRSLCPPLPKKLPIDKVFVETIANEESNRGIPTIPGSVYANGGPICCFQAVEPEEHGRPGKKLRAILLYTGSAATTTKTAGNCVLSPPLWCIPEGYFPSKKLDTLPPRPAQPLLFFSKYPANLGSKSFEPIQLLKMLVSDAV